MMALVLALAFAVLVAAILAAWVARLRRTLAQIRLGPASHEDSGSAHAADLEASVAALQRKNRELQSQIDDLQTEFSALNYSISHDLRAPLRCVDGFSQALVEDHGPQLSATAQDYLGRVRKGALQLNAMIEALLGLSRLVRAPVRVEAVDLGALAREVAAELEAADPSRRVEWDIQPGMVTRGDREQLRTLLRHLLGNAWKFSADRIVARISCRMQSEDPSATGETVYEVRDNGVGFDPQYAGKLFGVFQRLHAPGEFPGQGIGLATVQRIARRHGGRVAATAEPDRGAVFSFALPARREGEGTAPAPAASAPPAPASTDATSPAQTKVPVA